MKPITISLTALFLLTLPAAAQSIDTLLPSLTWPEDDLTTSADGCAANPPSAACAIAK